jgi:hypothetical protein
MLEVLFYGTGYRLKTIGRQMRSNLLWPPSTYLWNPLREMYLNAESVISIRRMQTKTMACLIGPVEI